jgi:hypothetical protein
VENRATTKDVTIGETKYRLSKADARTACWLFSILGANAVSGNILSALGKVSHAEFDEVQATVLRLISRLDYKDANEFPMPIVSGGGAWADQAVASDAGVVFKLTSQALMFNLSPFLAADESSSQPPAVE